MSKNGFLKGNGKSRPRNGLFDSSTGCIKFASGHFQG